MQRFTEQEQLQLSALPSLVGTAMIVAGGSGLGTIREMIVNSRTMLKGAEYYKTNVIIQSVIPVYSNKVEGVENAKGLREKVKAYIKSQDAKNKIQIREIALKEAREVNSILFQKATPLETDQYKSWLLEIAEEVAKAAKEGGILGFGGERVSAGEKNFFTELAAALHPVRRDAALP